MIKPFDALYTDLEKNLTLLSQEHRGPESYLQGIHQIKDRLIKLRTLGDKFIREGPREVEYFRNVWPAFYGRLFLYIQLYRTELDRLTMPADQWAEFVGRMEIRVGRFFASARDFWHYYKSGSPVINDQFTRAYNHARILETVGFVLDPDRSTLGSYRAARCLAMEGLKGWLQDERSALSAGMVSAADQGYSWGPSDADLAEWLFGLQAVQAIRYKGQPADISRLQKWAKLALGREVANIYDRGRILRNRKKERLAFTKKTASALERKWDEAEGKFE